ncbi:ABC transporter ced-7 [Aphelenchoides besseyi]|nr:ABC transporter ced-7 [Aphelenchoides besseyi]
MSLWYHLWLLVRKEILLIWRSKVWFFIEILLSLMLLPLIIIVVSKSSSDDIPSVSFDPVRLNGGSADLQQQVKNIARIYSTWCGRSSTLAYSGANSDELMFNVQKRYTEEPSLKTEKFDDVDSMKKVLLDDLNSTVFAICGKYLGGIIFDGVDAQNEELNYRILFPRRMGQKWHLDSFWTEDGPYAPVADLNNIPGELKYWSSGFLSIQFAIESAFLDMIKKPIDFPVYLQRMPAPQFRNSGITVFLKQTPILWCLIVTMTMLHTLKNIVSEKEAGIKTYMMVMGLESVAFYGAHFAIGLLKVTFILGICAIVFSFGLVYVSSSLFVVFSFLYGLSAISFGVLISTALRRPSLALTVALMAWIMLIIVDQLYNTSLTSIGHCFLISLNPYTAFKLGVKSLILAESTTTYIGWTNIFDNSTHSFAFGLAMLMLIVDVTLMILISLYLDAVWPTDNSPRRSPLFIFGYRTGNEHRFEVGHDEPDALNENMEPDGGANVDEADIDVRHMSKVWEGTGQMAVDNLSFRAYRGQVTVLLGHNGAGKSSTFSVISGSTSITAGNVYICKEDLESSLQYCQQQIGFCPQYNPLFARLTAREHLQLYAKLKSKNNDANLNDEIDTIAQQVQLKDGLDKFAESLSGGFKRKLCVAMALIGDSRVILLDEPTAGMDVEARHDVRILLEKAKKNRTVLLTTHYMDEADLLGDRIGIMVKGRMVCNGSPEFLKNRFGTGYILTIVSAHDDNLPYSQEDIVNNVLRVVHKHIPEARTDAVSTPEFSIILPANQKHYFANLFEELENRKTELKISSFGLSFNTLEQVFLRVGELAESPDDQTDSAPVDTNLLFADTNEYTNAKLWSTQLLAMIQRHFLNVFRNKTRTITPVLFSLLLFTLFVGMSKYNRPALHENRDFSLNQLETLSLPLVIWHAATAKIGFPFIAGQMKDMNLISIAPHTNLTQTLIEMAAKVSPPLGIGAVLLPNNTVLALFNGAAYHSPPEAVLLITNSMINKKPDSIKLSVEVYDVNTPETNTKNSSTDSNLVVALIVIMSFSSLVSTFVMPLVEENQCKFKHQLLLTKLHNFTYWFSYALWHLFMYSIFCGLLALLFSVFGWMKGRMLECFLVWFLYIWSSLPFVYCCSFIFKSVVKAYAALLSWNVIVSLFALLADVTMEALEWRYTKEFRSVVYVLLPSYSLGRCMVQIAILAEVEMFESASFSEILHQMIVCMTISGFVFWSILFFLESKYLTRIFHQLQCRIRKNAYQVVNAEMEMNEDDDVLRERDSVRTLGDENFALAVRDVYKYYGGFCAVRNLTFGVRQTDCFGLLGVNGAGKTSCFNILTGDLLADAGRVSIGGVDVSNGPVIGYCPQFDALTGDLTGRNVLTLIGNLNGLVNVTERVRNVLHCIRMTAHSNKLVKFYSGGQKRRLSIGVTLMSKSPLIMLDEPTAGIDAATRRGIWRLLTGVRQHNVAILLTSHSMDECEALCNRIGFMNKGTLISIGSSQHLKSRYGNSYLLTFTLENPNPDSARFLNNIVTTEFGAANTTDPPLFPTQHWEIPRVDGQLWSSMFRKAQTIAEKYAHTTHLPIGSDYPLIKDFTLTQNSLEQIFIRLAESTQESQSS